MISYGEFLWGILMGKSYGDVLWGFAKRISNEAGPCWAGHGWPGLAWAGMGCHGLAKYS